MAEHMVKDVPKYGPGVPPIGILWSALRKAGEAIELDHLAGVSGAAFFTLVDEECSDEVLWLQGRAAAESVLPYMGYRMTFIVSDLSRKTRKFAELPEDTFEKVRASIDKEVPVIVEGERDWGLITGYDDKGRYWLRGGTPWSAVHDMGHCPPWESGTEQMERWEETETFISGWGEGVDMCFLEKLGRGLPLKGAEHAAIRRAVEHVKRKDEGTKRYGLGALAFLVSLLERELKEPQWDEFTYGVSLPAQVIFATINRACAVRFLRGAKEILSGAAAAVEKAADIYGESSNAWLALQSTLPNPQRYYESKESVKKYAELLPSMVESLKKIRDIETRALTELEGAI